MRCPYCNKEIALQDAVFCPYCARSLRMAPKQTVVPIVAGALVITAACIALFVGIAGTAGFIEGINDYRFNLAYPSLTLAIFGILGFAFGVLGGIFSIMRRQLALSIVGIAIVAVSGIAISIAAFLMLYMTVEIASLLGITIFLLSISAAILAVFSKGEFH